MHHRHCSSCRPPMAPGLYRLIPLLTFALMLSTAQGAKGTTVTGPEPFGKTADGTAVSVFTLTNQRGMRAKIMTRGATIVELHVPDKQGKTADVVLGFNDLAGYESDANAFFGCVTGRVANRIARGRFKLNGTEYTLAINNEPNHLHGGVKRSLDKVVWEANVIDASQGPAVQFRYTSPNGEEGYPGKLDITVTYSLGENNDLRIEYKATSDQPTPVNLTNHSYLNLSGEGSATALDHELMIHADRYTPTDDTLIPTGKIADVAGTPLDFRMPHVIGERIEQLTNTPYKGYDHNFVLKSQTGQLAAAARLKDPKSGRVLTVSTTEPGVQLYTGNFLSGQKGKQGKEYKHRSAVCLETQHYPDSVNRPEFPSVVLKPGETYRQVTVFAFSAE